MPSVCWVPEGRERTGAERSLLREYIDVILPYAGVHEKAVIISQWSTHRPVSWRGGGTGSTTVAGMPEVTYHYSVRGFETGDGLYETTIHLWNKKKAILKYTDSVEPSKAEQPKIFQAMLEFLA